MGDKKAVEEVELEGKMEIIPLEFWEVIRKSIF